MTVFIDRYDLDRGELDDRWWKITKKAAPEKKQPLHFPSRSLWSVVSIRLRTLILVPF